MSCSISTDHLCGSSLDPLQEVSVVHIPISPEVNPLLQVSFHKSTTNGWNHLTRPAGYTYSDAHPSFESTLTALLQAVSPNHYDSIALQHGHGGKSGPC